nr:hypothetical protein [Candidatus Woesearchaeota archaeon]
MEMSFYPIDIDYIDREIKAEIRIFGKTDDGKRICAIDKTYWLLFLSHDSFDLQL